MVNCAMETTPTTEKITPTTELCAASGSEGLWRLQLLGGLRAACGTALLEKFQTQKTASLLAYFAFYSHRRHTREEIIDLLWPDAEPEAGRNRLSQALVWLRPHLELSADVRGTVLLADRQTAGLNPQAITVDALTFEAAARSALAATPQSEIQQLAPLLEAAAALYTGDLLPGHYEDWVLTERQRLLSLFLSLLQRLISFYEQEARWDRALDYARQALASDPMAEDLHLTLIRLLSASSQEEAAQRQFRELERVLDKELGEKPSPAAYALMQAISVRKSELPGRVSNAVLPQSPVIRPLTRFFGRQDELATLHTLLTSESVRLVTLTGTGGAGKTRLALEASQQLTEDYQGAVWFIPLADVTDPAMLPSVLSDALQLPRLADTSFVKQVTDALSQRPSLLVLDNLEHLVEGAAPLIRSLLERTATLKVLVTSRQRLTLDGEREVSVLPLASPMWEDAAGQKISLEHLIQVESVRLFVDRAQSVRPSFAVTPQNAEAIARLCTRLEGLPLAIELCASWAQTLTPTQMLTQLTRRFDLLVSRRSDIPPRHRSLRAALEYSYLLLPPDLQQFFVQLSLFRGGWTLEAAEAVCLDSLPGSTGLTALTHLTELRERSLLIADETLEPGETQKPGTENGMRYRMLEALREFAAEQRTLAIETTLRQRHAAYFLGLAEEARLHLTGPQQTLWLTRLEAEHDNLRGALRWAIETQDAETGLRLAVALSKFWEIRGYFREAQQWLERLLPFTADPISPTDNRVLRAQTLNAYANAFDGLTDFVSAETYAQEALAAWRELGEASGMAYSLAMLGSIAMMREDYGPAVQLLQEARFLAQSVGDDAMAAGVVHSLGRIALAQQNWSEALETLSESLTLHRALGDRNKAAAALNNLGLVARYRGDLKAARDLLNQALSEHRALGDRPRMAISLLNIGTVARLDQHYHEAEAVLRPALTLALEVDDRRVQTWCIKELGHLLCAQSEWQRGIRLLSASESLRQVLGMSFSPADPGELSRDVSLAKTALGHSMFDAAWQAGSRWTIQEACAQAMRFSDEAGQNKSKKS